jgi:hypothetical protein
MDTDSAGAPDPISGQTDNQNEPPLAEYDSTRSGKTEADEGDTGEDKHQADVKAEDKATKEREKKNNANKKPREQYSCVECFR